MSMADNIEAAFHRIVEAINALHMLIGDAGSSSCDIDGGSSSSVYTDDQMIDGGGVNG